MRRLGAEISGVYIGTAIAIYIIVSSENKIAIGLDDEEHLFTDCQRAEDFFWGAVNCGRKLFRSYEVYQTPRDVLEEFIECGEEGDN